MTLCTFELSRISSSYFVIHMLQGQESCNEAPAGASAPDTEVFKFVMS